MTEKVIGWIESVTFGLDDRNWLGVHFSLMSTGCGTQTSVYVGSTQGEFNLAIKKLLGDAKVRDVMALKGKPIEFSFTGGALSSWRILTEVIPK